MSGSSICRQKFEELKACVIIPTYNNEQTLAAVISDVAGYTGHIIVVNDGSTDNTRNIIDSFPGIQCISYEKNVGKGWALRKAFEYAVSKGYDFAVTIDSDGQHFAIERNAVVVVTSSGKAGIQLRYFFCRQIQGENFPFAVQYQIVVGMPVGRFKMLLNGQNGVNFSCLDVQGLDVTRGIWFALGHCKH